MTVKQALGSCQFIDSTNGFCERLPIFIARGVGRVSGAFYEDGVCEYHVREFYENRLRGGTLVRPLEPVLWLADREPILNLDAAVETFLRIQKADEETRNWDG